MKPKKKIHPPLKTGLHPRNKHRERYDFKQLIESCRELEPFVKVNEYGDESVDFFNPRAVKMLNKALLKYFYDLSYWDIPAGYLCPPIPGRAEYIHHIADLLADQQQDQVLAHAAMGRGIKCLDIGVGANCVYPIIAVKEYGWIVVGSDVDPLALESAQKIVEMNSDLKDNVSLRLQPNPKYIFQGIIEKEEHFAVTICNPPFHASLAEAQAGTMRKLSNLKQKKVTRPLQNFGGQQTELWCQGGEEQFVKDMIWQSKDFAQSSLWFSTLVSKQAHLDHAYLSLKKAGAVIIKTIPLSHGNKTSRILAWSFLSAEKQKTWKKAHLNIPL